MSVVMKLFGTADGRSTPYDGQYLKNFDFEAGGGTGLIDMTPDIAEAKKFPNMAAAFAFYNTQPKCCPTRLDGKPNKPLTTTNWEFSNAEPE